MTMIQNTKAVNFKILKTHFAGMNAWR